MRWLAATTSVEIERPIDDVWAFVTDIGNMPHWVDGVSEAILTPEADAAASGLEVGTPFMSQYTYAGRRHTMEYVVTVLEPPGHYALESTEGPYPVELTAAARRRAPAGAVTLDQDHPRRLGRHDHERDVPPARPAAAPHDAQADVEGTRPLQGGLRGLSERRSARARVRRRPASARGWPPAPPRVASRPARR